MKLNWEYSAKNRKIDPNLTMSQLADIILAYEPGGCLCGHFESCGVCSRPDSTRIMEVLSTRLARLVKELNASPLDS